MSKRLSGSAVIMILLTAVFSTPFSASTDEDSKVVVHKGLEKLDIGGLWYLSYQDGTEDGESYSQMRVKRSYINIKKTILTWASGNYLEARITPDAHQDSTGDLKVRLKYAYGKFNWKSLSWEPWLEFGQVHTPWLDFEEHVNMYRMQDTMFMERNGTFNSADFGFTFGGFFGSKLENAPTKYYPGKYGSFAVGVYNGGGYHAAEANDNKVIEGRATVRPMPQALPGMQISYFGISGKGNTAAEPDWSVNTGMLSYEHRRGVATLTYYSGKGSQGGIAVDEITGQSLCRDGYSLFGELRLPPHDDLSVIARYDDFDFNDDVDGDEEKRYILGVAYDMGHHNTLLLDYDKVTYADDSPDDDRLQLTLQIDF